MIRRVIYSNFLCVNTVTNKKYRLAAVLFIGGLEEIRLHFCNAKIEVPLRPAAAGGAHPRRI